MISDKETSGQFKHSWCVISVQPNANVNKLAHATPPSVAVLKQISLDFWRHKNLVDLKRFYVLCFFLLSLPKLGLHNKYI